MVGIAPRNDARADDDSDRRAREIGHRRRRRDALVLLDQDLGDERAARDPRQEHLDRPLVSDAIPRHELPDPVSNVALLERRSERLAANHLEPEGGHSPDDAAHVGGVETGGHGQEIAPVCDDGRVLRIHPGHRGNAEGSGHAARQGTAQTVAAGVESGAGDHEIGPVALQRIPHARAGHFFALRDVVVAADERGHHRALGPQRLLERASRAHRSLAHLERCLSPLLAADAAEELVQVVHHADWLFHGASVPSQSAAAAERPPPSWRATRWA